MTRKAVIAVVAVVAGLLTITAAIVDRSLSAEVRPAAATQSSPSGTVVIDWNRELLRIVRTPKAQPATIHPTRSFAILHAAIYDAVVSVTRDGSPYGFRLTAPRSARPDAAAATAGHDVLAALYPARADELDRELAAELAAIPDGTGKEQGITVGRNAAERMLAIRSQDGSGTTPPPFPPGTQPGDYRPTPPTLAPPVFTHWAAVTPFVLHRAAQFRPEPPPDPASTASITAEREVESLGRDTSTTRTADQTVAARFWSAPIWNYWNEIAQNAALAHHTGLVRTARLFADLDLALADSTIAFYDAKYHDHVWRPITAIREGPGGDPSWTPLATTPADPSYPGAHSVISSAASTVLTSYFGERNEVVVTSEVLPGVVRSFGSYHDAATEAGLSRIFAGLHTRLDHDSGLRLGREVAAFVMDHATSGGDGR